MRTLFVLFALAACAVPVGPSVPDMTDMTDLAEDATYMMFTPGGGQCTAWAVSDRQVITAGHCCDEEGDYLLVHKSLRSTTARVTFYEDSDYERPPVDACILRTSSYVGPGLPVAADMPEVGARVGFVGYPKGEYTISAGEYAGDIDGVQPWNDYTSTAPCNRGASGSAMYTDAGVYGILVRLIVVGDNILPGSRGCVASPLPQIQYVIQHGV